MRAWLWLVMVLCSACLPEVGPLLVDDAGVVADAGSGGGNGSTGGGGGGGGGGTASCTDGQRNGTESDVDCGGSCGPCGLDAGCAGPTDCQSGRCHLGACLTPAASCNTPFSNCSNFTDLTMSATPVITFPGGNDRYSPKCVRVRLGQTVTFQGDFGPHPMTQACGPVTGLFNASSGSSLSVTFTEALGTYGYYCTQHGSQSGTGMAGAIEVVP